MKIRKNKNKTCPTKPWRSKGFSLIEMIIYVGIFSLFIVGLVAFANILTKSRLNSQQVMEVNEQGTSVIRLLTREIRSAKSINTPGAGNADQKLSLETYNFGTNPTIFSLTEDGILQMAKGSSDPVDLLNQKVIMSDLIFTNLAGVSEPGTINIRFILKNKNSTGGNYQNNFYGTASVRQN